MANLKELLQGLNEAEKAAVLRALGKVDLVEGVKAGERFEELKERQVKNPVVIPSYEEPQFDNSSVIDSAIKMVRKIAQKKDSSVEFLQDGSMRLVVEGSNLDLYRDRPVRYSILLKNSELTLQHYGDGDFWVDGLPESSYVVDLFGALAKELDKIKEVEAEDFDKKSEIAMLGDFVEIEVSSYLGIKAGSGVDDEIWSKIFALKNDLEKFKKDRTLENLLPLLEIVEVKTTKSMAGGSEMKEAAAKIINDAKDGGGDLNAALKLIEKFVLSSRKKQEKEKEVDGKIAIAATVFSHSAALDESKMRGIKSAINDLYKGDRSFESLKILLEALQAMSGDGQVFEEGRELTLDLIKKINDINMDITSSLIEEYGLSYDQVQRLNDFHNPQEKIDEIVKVISQKQKLEDQDFDNISFIKSQIAELYKSVDDRFAELALELRSLKKSDEKLTPEQIEQERERKLMVERMKEKFRRDFQLYADPQDSLPEGVKEFDGYLVPQKGGEPSRPSSARSDVSSVSGGSQASLNSQSTTGDSGVDVDATSLPDLDESFEELQKTLGLAQKMSSQAKIKELNRMADGLAGKVSKNSDNQASSVATNANVKNSSVVGQSNQQSGKESSASQGGVKQEKKLGRVAAFFEGVAKLFSGLRKVNKVNPNVGTLKGTVDSSGVSSENGVLNGGVISSDGAVRSGGAPSSSPKVVRKQVSFKKVQVAEAPSAGITQDH